MSRDQLGWIETFMAALAHAGVRDIVVCPGSRSTPLALAVDVTTDLVCHRAVDERSAAFFALGQTRVTGRPSAVLCTSGTAAAHFFPAVIEAAHCFLPLLLVTADRPWDLVGVSAPQTMDQHALFGGYARGFFELGSHESSLADAVAQRVAVQAAMRSLSPTPGPVQINVRLRKPLEPTAPWPGETRESGAKLHPTRAFLPRTSPASDAIELLADRLAQARRGLIVCGPALLDRSDKPLRDAVRSLAKETGFVLLAETTSQARFGKADPDVTTCSSFDLVLRDVAFRETIQPEVILELGAPPTSGNYAEYVSKCSQAERFVVAPHGWNDPAQNATGLVFAEPVDVCHELVQRLSRGTHLPDARWTQAFRRADALVWALAEQHASGTTLTEAMVARTVVAQCPDDAVFVVGNSLPVRDVDVWAPPRPEHLDVLHQRGVSGIDGLIAGAAGAASVAKRPVVLLLGDTSTLHDLTSLALARHVSGPLVIVVVQNQGGRIFERLPIARAIDRDRFDKFFTMHESVDLERAAEAFGIAFARTNETDTFVQLFDEAVRCARVTLIEAVVPPDDGTARMGRFRTEVSEKLRSLLEEVRL